MLSQARYKVERIKKELATLSRREKECFLSALMRRWPIRATFTKHVMTDEELRKAIVETMNRGISIQQTSPP